MKKEKNKINKFLKTGILFFGISILLWNCEKETFIPSEEIIAETNNEIDFKIENLTFKQASSEVIFSNLKNNFDIEEPTFNTKKGGYFSKVKKGLSKTSKDFSDLDTSIDMNSLKKITTQDYTSYTMRLVEPQNTTSTFSNVVVQESNGVQEIFTFRYTPIENQSKTAIRTSSFEGTYTMTKGICLPDQIGDCSNNEDTGGGGGGGAFVEICNTVTIITSVGCQCSHQPGNYCAGCGGPGTNHYSTETREECYWDYVGNNGTSGTGSVGGTSTAGGSSSNNGNNVITTPITGILPEGALQVFFDLIKPNQEEIDWINEQLNNNEKNIAQLWNLIALNNNSSDVVNFVKDGIKEMMSENEIDYNVSDLIDFEPVQAYMGTILNFKNLIDNSPRRVGKFKGIEASNYLKSLGETKFNFPQFRPLPTQTGFFNNKKGRYIYTKKGGWIDMAHFMFYAGKAYQYKLDGKSNPIGEAVQDGFKQEL
jgi:hypothetical protein